jgi:hypothetical protein
MLKAELTLIHLYCWESILAIVVFPSQKIIIYMNIWCIAIM